MYDDSLVLSTAGFHARADLVALVERDFDGYLQAVDEGLPVEEFRGPLVSTLLLAEILRPLADWAAAWLQRRLTASQSSPPLPDPWR
jgi:hypothetical protein